MRVECLRAEAQDLANEYTALGYTPHTVFDVVPNQHYTVYSISVWSGLLMYLIVAGQSSTGHWYPAVLFRVVDDSLPSSWKFAYWGDEPDIQVQAVIGYEELARDSTQFDKLAEHAGEAILVFQRRKAEIDEQYDAREPHRT